MCSVFSLPLGSSHRFLIGSDKQRGNSVSLNLSLLPFRFLVGWAEPTLLLPQTNRVLINSLKGKQK